MRVVLSGCGESNVSQNAGTESPHPGELGDVVVGEEPGDVELLDVVDVDVLLVDDAVEDGADVVEVDVATVVLVVLGSAVVVDSGSVVVELDDDDVTSVVVGSPPVPASQPSAGAGGVYTRSGPTAIGWPKQGGNSTASAGMVRGAGGSSAEVMPTAPRATARRPTRTATRPRRITTRP